MRRGRANRYNGIDKPRIVAIEDIMTDEKEMRWGSPEFEELKTHRDNVAVLEYAVRTGFRRGFRECYKEEHGEIDEEEFEKEFEKEYSKEREKNSEVWWKMIEMKKKGMGAEEIAMKTGLDQKTIEFL
ncbi:MAG: hypothetical protein II951_07810 [Bacteroidales bacterium]|nr:hypothetical protein [Bacteroidales bacterium]